MKRLLLLPLLGLLAACGGGGSDEATPTVAPASATEGGATVLTSTGSAAAAGGIAAATPTTEGHQVAVMPDGTELHYTLVLPDGFDPAKTYPVLLALPPGGQDQEVVDSVVDRVWKDEAKRLGWVVVSPAAPGALFYDEASAKYLPDLVAQMEAMFRAEGGKVHLAGVSNGGLSAYRAALDHPELYLDLLTFPGMPPEQADDVAKLQGLPVADWVGELDSGWREGGEATVAKLKALGSPAQITVVPGESHILESVGGKEYFDFLEQQRPTP